MGGALAACGTTSATSDGGAPADAAPPDDATILDAPNGFGDGNVTPYDGPIPVQQPCNPPCATGQYCYLEHISGGRAPFDEAGADGGEAGDAEAPDAADAQPADAAPAPGCYAEPPTCVATPTCACLLANVGHLTCDPKNLTCTTDIDGRPTLLCTLDLP